MKVLISGLGVAGLTLAYWLARHGFEPVIVESAPRRRTGGYIIDFWGAGFNVAERMGLLPRLMERGYAVQEVRFVDDEGRRVGGFSADVFVRATGGRFVSLPRGELSAAIQDALPASAETIFDDSIAAIEAHHGGARVRFDRAPAREFDLVVGADGLHSNVRRIAFGPEASFERYLGYKVAAFEVAGYEPRDENVYVSFTLPGRQAARFAMRDDRTMFLFVFREASPSVPKDARGQKAAIHDAFDGAGWECQQILTAMDACDAIYFDRVSQIRMDRWTLGRVALVGDAAYCPSLLAGEGAALGMLGAYVLAGELRRTGGEPRAAFARYEAMLRPLMLRKQRLARRFAASFAPRTMLGVALRNIVTRAFSVPLIADIFLGQSLKDDFSTPDYL